MRAASPILVVCLTILLTAEAPASSQTGTLDLRGGSSALCPHPDESLLRRPHPTEGPTLVSVGVLFLDLIALDDVNQAFTTDLYLTLQWRDTRLTDPARGTSQSVCSLLVDQIWIPVVELPGVRHYEKHYDDVLAIDAGGVVTYAQRLSLDIAAPLDLRDFPFDRHTLAVEIRPVFSGVEEINFAVLDELTGSATDRGLTGWSVAAPSASVTTRHAPRLQIDQAVFRLALGISRESGFYVIKALAPITLIILMSWAVFWIDPQQIAPQVGLAATSMLTLIAFQFAFSDLLPRISYLTRADRFILSSSLLVFLALVEVIATTTLARHDRLELASRVDRGARIAFPLALGVILGYAFAA